MSGRAESGWIVCRPPPGMLNAMVSKPALALASRIACRSEPAPLSAVVETVKVLGTVRSSRRSHLRRRQGRIRVEEVIRFADRDKPRIVMLRMRRGLRSSDNDTAAGAQTVGRGGENPR